MSKLEGDGPLELIAAKVHEAWMENKQRQGVTSRKSETGEELMVSYVQLSEAAKNLDRGSVAAVLEAIAELGLELRPATPAIVNNNTEEEIASA